MEAVWRIEIDDFPAFIITDDKGNDFYSDLMKKKPSPTLTRPPPDAWIPTSTSSKVTAEVW